MRLLLLFLLSLLISCQNRESSEIIDNLLLGGIHQHKKNISIEWGYEKSDDELMAVLNTFEADLRKGGDLDATIMEMNAMIGDYKESNGGFDDGHWADSFHNIINSEQENLDNKKYACYVLYSYLSFFKKSIVLNHNWKVKLLNLDTVYVPNRREVKYLYMLFNPLQDTIRATEMNYGSALGDVKTIDIYVDGEPGDVVEKIVRLPVTNPYKNEKRIYTDTVILKIIDD